MGIALGRSSLLHLRRFTSAAACAQTHRRRAAAPGAFSLADEVATAETVSRFSLRAARRRRSFFRAALVPGSDGSLGGMTMTNNTPDPSKATGPDRPAKEAPRGIYNPIT